MVEVVKKNPVPLRPRFGPVERQKQLEEEAVRKSLLPPSPPSRFKRKSPCAYYPWDWYICSAAMASNLEKIKEFHEEHGIHIDCENEVG